MGGFSHDAFLWVSYTTVNGIDLEVGLEASFHRLSFGVTMKAPLYLLDCTWDCLWASASCSSPAPGHRMSVTNEASGYGSVSSVY